MSNLDQAWQLHQSGRYAEAEALYQAALTDPAKIANACCFLGILYFDTGRHVDSLKAYDQAVQIQPSFPVALSNRANTLMALGRYDEAVVSCENALALKPDYPTAWTNLGAVQTKMGRFDDAAESFRKSLELAPDDNESAHRNLGAALVSQGEFTEADKHTSQALAINPKNAEAHRNRAIIQLLKGELAEGWDEYEWRWQCPDISMPQFDQPLYNGESLQGKTLLLHAEQGLGDTLHFVRYAEVAKQAGARVIVQCQTPLCQILQSYRHADDVFPRDVPLPKFDFHLPLMSAPRTFGTRLDSIPSRTPYLRPDPILQQKWDKRLEGIEGLRVGIVWQGSRDHDADEQRSFAFAEFDALARDGVTFVPLQVGDDRDQLTTTNTRLRIYDPGTRLDRDCGAFMDSAALISLLDVVISCDTSIAHLSAALDVPTWIALCISPDWRWLLDRDDSPWYPSVRLFRQRVAHQWSDVFLDIAAALNDLEPQVKPNPESIQLEVGAGELLDKLTILEIKSERIQDETKRNNVLVELNVLQARQRHALPWTPELVEFYDALKSINTELWDIEDAIRRCEAHSEFGTEFIALARSVYHQNDRRAAVKRQINDLVGSRIIEEKSYD